MSKVSIIIPVYNSQKYLKKCLNSVCNQTLRDIEIIILNDASTDNSLDIIRCYEKMDSRIKIINVDKNLGPGALRNIGIKMADGDYIGFVDSDDYIEPNMYYELYNGIVRSDSDIASCGFIKEICGIDYRKILGKDSRNLDGYSIIEPKKSPDSLFSIPVSCWDKIYRHDFIERFSFPENLKFEDYPMSINMLGSSNQIFRLRRSYYHYRVRPNSLTTSDQKIFKVNTLDIFECNNQIKKFYMKSGILTTFEETLNSIFIMNAVSQLIPMLSVSMPFSKKKCLINYYINLMDIEFSNWETNELLKKRKKSSIRLGPCMYFIDKLFLDDGMRVETSREKVKQRIIELCDEKKI